MTPAPAPPATYRPQPAPGAYIPRVETRSLYTGFIESKGQPAAFALDGLMTREELRTLMRRIESGE